MDTSMANVVTRLTSSEDAAWPRSPVQTTKGDV